MEFVVVSYPDDRNVFIDGQSSGQTNQTLMVEEGHHDFDLGDPKDYQPETQAVAVTGTTSLDPMIVTFSPQDGVA